MVFGTNKEKGNTGLALAIAYYGSNGYTVSIPLNDTQDYDLIVDKDNKLYKVQVKSTGTFTDTLDGRVYKLSLRSCGGSLRKVYKTVTDTNIDILFAIDAEQNMYSIPIEALEGRTNTISLGPKITKRSAPSSTFNAEPYKVYL